MADSSSKRRGGVPGIAGIAAVLVGVVVLVGVGLAARDDGGGAGQQRIGTGRAAPRPVGSETQRRFSSAMTATGLPVQQLVEPPGRYRELRVTITRGNGLGPPERVAAGAAELTMRVTDRRSGLGDPPGRRAFQPAPGELLVVVVDRSGAARWAAPVPDPRLIRAELPDADGRLSGQVLERPSAELRLQIPDRAELVEARVYRTHAGPPGPRLEPIGSFPVG